jgi:hypothetical protein
MKQFEIQMFFITAEECVLTELKIMDCCPVFSSEFSINAVGKKSSFILIPKEHVSQ